MIADKIRKYIEDNGISQTVLSRKTGMTKQAMSTSLRGLRKLTAEEYVSICDALGVGTDFFADESKENV